MSDYPSNEIYFEIDDLMPDYLQKEAKLEELIFGLTKESFEEIKSFIEENNIINDLIFRLNHSSSKSSSISIQSLWRLLDSNSTD